MQTHYESILEDNMLVDKVRQIRQQCDDAFTKLDDMVAYSASMASFFTGV